MNTRSTVADSDLASFVQDGGIVPAAKVQRLVQTTGMTPDELMLALLPMAAELAAVPISGYRVGAVAAGLTTGHGAPTLYLGANVEFSAEALNATVHAEQAATLNAWQNGERGLSALATSSAPCGHCRQFLYELVTAPQLRVLVPGGIPSWRLLIDLLPDPFGPRDLGIEAGLMGAAGPTSLVLATPTGDDLAAAALVAARESYAPYTGAYAGCAIRTTQGRIFLGRSVENAAYSPTISSVQAALALLNLHRPGLDPRSIVKVAVVERPTKTSQARLAARLVECAAPHASLAYYEAVLP